MTKQSRIQDAWVCVFFIFGFTLGALSVWFTIQEPDLTKRELENIRVAARMDSQCWGVFESEE